MIIKQKRQDEQTGEEVETGAVFTRFKLARNWFSFEQTDGDDYEEPSVTPAWIVEQALERLNILEKPFSMVNGNIQGYAVDSAIAVSPVAEYPQKTRFHELAHIVLGHTTEEGCWDTASLPKKVKEAEAEGVAYILCALLGLPGLAESRGYIQSWLDGQALPEKSAQRIFGAAQTILEAGKPQ